MVEHSDHKAIDTEKKKFDEYWKLPGYWLSWYKHLKEDLRAVSYKIPSGASKETLMHLSSRRDRGLLSYNNCSPSELRAFCIRRRLSLPRGSQPKKEEFVKILEDADEAATFRRFLDLPPELRTSVYRFYFKSLPRLEQPVQPPISKTPVIRAESLPIFYQTCTFVLNMKDVRAGVNYKNEHSNRSVKVKGDFWDHTDKKYLKLIRHIFIDSAVYGPICLIPPRRGTIHIVPKNQRVRHRLGELQPPALVQRIIRQLKRMGERLEGKRLRRADVRNLRQLIRTHTK
jgi:hypothetical protein